MGALSLMNNDRYVTAALFAGTFAATYLVWNRLSKRKNSNNDKFPPSIGCLPIIGSLPYCPDIPNMHTFFLDKAYQGLDIMSLQVGSTYIVVLSSLEPIKEVLSKQSVSCADRPDSYTNSFVNPNSKGIIEGHYNAAFRKFHQLSLSILREFGFGQRVMEDRITAEVEDLIESLKDLKGEEVNPKQLLSASVLSVIGSIIIGDRLKDPKKNQCVGDFTVGYTKTLTDLFPVEFIHLLLHLPKYRSILTKVIVDQESVFQLAEKEAAKCLKADEEQSTESFISHFIDKAGGDLDIEQLKYTVRDTLLAGFETSSTTLLWALLSLANRVDIQEKLQSEIDSVVPRDRLPSLDDKSKLIYVEAFTLEVMRRFTLVPLSVPRAALEEINVGQYIIPKGATIMPNLYAVHMNKNTWGDPENFRPERFLDSTGTSIIDKDRIIPFSLGKRSCLGELLARQELYLFITGLLQQFHIKLPQGVDHIDDKEVVGFTSSPQPYSVRFIARK